MTGLQLLQEVRADARLKAMPFIMITAESKTENVVAAKQAGVSNYIVKPFNAETLREKIERCLAMPDASLPVARWPLRRADRDPRPPPRSDARGGGRGGAGRAGDHAAAT